MLQYEFYFTKVRIVQLYYLAHGYQFSNTNAFAFRRHVSL